MSSSFIDYLTLINIGFPFEFNVFDSY